MRVKVRVRDRVRVRVRVSANPSPNPNLDGVVQTHVDGDIGRRLDPIEREAAVESA